MLGQVRQSWAGIGEARQADVRSGEVRLGAVRSCYAAYRRFSEPFMRCVSIIGYGVASHGGASPGTVR